MDNYTNSSEEREDLLHKMIDVAPVIQKLMPFDCMIGITDTKKFLYSIYGEKIRFDFELAGKELPPEDAIYQAMHSGKQVVINVPKEAFGVAFKSAAVPVKDKNGNTIGGIGVGFDLENSEKIMGMAGTLSYSSNQTASVVEDFASSSQDLAEHQAKLQTLTNAIVKEVEETGNILQFINSVASTSRILGLNAAIEAARAGEVGKGFSVVAKEIRKMAEDSANSVKSIEGILSKIKSYMDEIEEKVEKTVEIGQQQAAASEELSASVEEIASLAGELEKSSLNIIG